MSTLLIRCGDVELNPGPVGKYPDLDYHDVDNNQILGEEDIGDIMKDIVHIKANYKAFGMILGLSYAQLEAIQRTPLCIVDIGAALTEVVLAWLRQKYNTARFGLPTWRKIVEAIDSEAGGNNHKLAKEIAARHPVISGQNVVVGPVSSRPHYDDVSTPSPTLRTSGYDYEERRSRPVSPIPTYNFGSHKMQQLPSASEGPYDSCRRLLATCYLEQIEDGEETNWPPVKTTMFVPFTMIKQKTKQQTSSFVTVRQQVDSTLVGEAKIEYSDLLCELQSKSGMRIIIEGRPGSGKTTLVIEISKDWAKGEILQSKLVFLVQLRMLHGLNKLTLFSMLSTVFEDLSASGLLESLCSHITLQSGEGVVFALDGLDEYSPMSKDDFIHKLVMKRCLPKSTVLITSRPAGTQNYRRNASMLIEVVGFTGAQIPEYINRYFADDMQKAQKLISHLKQHRNLMNTCYSPLHLNMLVFLYEEDIELPATETQMYLHFTLSILLRSIHRRNDTPSTAFLNSFDDLSPEDKSLFNRVCKLAFNATVSMKQSFKSSELSDKKIIKPGGKGSDEDTLGLVVVDRQVGIRGKEEVYSFFHLTFQEYLAAVYIAGLDPSHQQQLVRMYRRNSALSLMWKFVCGALDYSIESSEVIFTHILYSQVCLDIMTKIYFAHESQRGECCAQLIKNGILRLPSKEQLTISDCTAIGYVVSSATTINPGQQVAVEFDKSYFSIEGVVSFLQQVVHVLLDLRILGSKTASAFLEGLSRCPVIDLIRIKIFHAKLGVSEMQNFIKGLRNCLDLLEIVLPDSNIDATGVSVLSGGFRHWKSLQVLNLDGNTIGEEGAKVLSSALVHCSALQCIDLSRSKLGDAGVKNLADSFVNNNCKQLEKLSLEKIGLGDDGLLFLMQGLKGHSSLRELNIRKNSVSPSGVQSLVDSPVLAHLQVINLRENKLGDNGVKIFVKSVTELDCNTLVKLDLFNNSITDEGLLHLSKLIEAANSLEALDIRANLFTEYEILREAERSRTEEMAKLVIQA